MGQAGPWAGRSRYHDATKAWASKHRYIYMTIKRCGCGRTLNAQNTKFLGKVDGLLWFNCKACNSTAVKRAPKTRK